MAFNNDRIFYTAFNDYGRNGLEAIVDPSMTRAELVEAIRRGELGYDNIVQVHAYNPSEGIALDVTAEILEEVEDAARRLRDLEDFPLSRFAPSKDEIMAGFDRAIAALKEA